MTYDVVLVHAFSRIHAHYLCLVRHLAPSLRIGVWVAPIDKKVKTPETERAFLALCRELGADVLDEGPHVCRLLTVPQYRYREGVLGELARRVRAARRVALQTFGHGAENLAPLADAGIERLFVYDRHVFDNKLKTEDERRWVADRFEVIEMGSPFAKYPVFPDVQVEWLVAFPTDLSFPSTANKVRFATNVARLLAAFPPDDRVALKLHNVSDGGRLLERDSLAFRLGESVGAAGVDVPLVGAPGRAGESLARLALGAAYRRVTRRTTPLTAVTPYFNLGLELFLPHVRRGLVTGRSSVVWYALVHRIPVYNCDDETGRARADSVLDSYRAFGVSPCGGRLTFDPAAFDRIAASTREADLVDLIRKEL